MPDTYNSHIAHITAADGTIFQVLNDAGDDWDEAATRAAYEQWVATQGAPPAPAAPAA